jgi:hypothetical protein
MIGGWRADDDKSNVYALLPNGTSWIKWPSLPNNRDPIAVGVVGSVSGHQRLIAVGAKSMSIAPSCYAIPDRQNPIICIDDDNETTNRIVEALSLDNIGAGWVKEDNAPCMVKGAASTVFQSMLSFGVRVVRGLIITSILQSLYK